MRDLRSSKLVEEVAEISFVFARRWNVLSSTRWLIRGGTRCLQRVAKTDAALPPDILRLRR
jgi:hypothetical protein